MSEQLHGYALARALMAEAEQIATEERAELVRQAAKEIEALILENRRLSERCQGTPGFGLRGDEAHLMGRG